MFNGASFKADSLTLRNNTVPEVALYLDNVEVVKVTNVTVDKNRFFGFMLMQKVNDFTIENANINSNVMTSKFVFLRAAQRFQMKNLKVVNNSFTTMISVFDCINKFVMENVTVDNNTISGAAKILELGTYTISTNALEVIIKDIDIVNNESNGRVFQLDLYCETIWTISNILIKYKKIEHTNSIITVFHLNFIRFSRFQSFFLAIDCPTNYNPTDIKQLNTAIFTQLQFSCISCKSYQYNVIGGKRIINDSKLETVSRSKIFDMRRYDTRIIDECKTCPIGGDCINEIKSRDNFYGFISNQSTVQFLQCPNQYCCSDKGKPCTSYNTCDHHRKETLCGSCVDGYYINFFSNECSSNTECTILHQISFWLIFITSGVIIGIVINSLKYTVLIIKQQALKIVLHLKTKLKRKRAQRNISNLHIRSDTLKNSIHSTGQSMMLMMAVNSNQQSKETQTFKSDFQEVISFSAILNILMSFYQLKALIKIDLSDVFPATSSIGSTFFNLDMNANVLFIICPRQSLDVIYRDFIKSYLMAGVMLTANVIRILIFWVFQYSRVCRKSEVNIVTFITKINCFFIIIL